MNTEEKAKAYDEAIKKLHEIITMDNHPVLPKEIGEFLFPQLRESEDEKTRKRLIEFISDIKKISESGRSSWAVREDDIEMCNAFLSYLEKQKEQKPIPDWMPKFLDELRSKKNYFDWDEHRDFEGHILAIINWIAPDYFKRKEEQNPAEWSEEDEKMVRFYEDDYNNNLSYMPMSDVIENRIKFKDWLLNRLKSIRLSWKPSEEQTEALRYVAYEHGNSSLSPYSIANKTLASLYEQLKKL